MELKNEAEIKFVQTINNMFENYLDKFKKSATTANIYTTGFENTKFQDLYNMFSVEKIEKTNIKLLQNCAQEIVNRICKKLNISCPKINLLPYDDKRAGKYLELKNEINLHVLNYPLTTNNKEFFKFSNLLIVKTIYHECLHHEQKIKAYKFLFENKEIGNNIDSLSLIMCSFFEKSKIQFINNPIECELFDEYTQNDFMLDNALSYLPAEINVSANCHKFAKHLFDKNIIDKKTYCNYLMLHSDTNSKDINSLNSFSSQESLYKQKYGVSAINSMFTYLMPENAIIKKINENLNNKNWQEYNGNLLKFSEFFKNEITKAKNTKDLQF